MPPQAHDLAAALTTAQRRLTPLAGVPRIANYDELDAGQGREINFRPDRYRRADLGTVEPSVQVVAGGQVHACTLVDISQNGLAFVPPTGFAPSAGDVLTEMTVTFDGHEAYRGAARIISVRPGSDGPVVGVCFADGLVSIEDVLTLRDINAWTRDRATSLELSVRPWYVSGYDRFKALVSDFRMFLEDAEIKLREMEASLPFQAIHGESDSPVRNAVIESLRREFVPTVVRYSEEIDASIRGASAHELQALKDLAVRQLHGFLMQSPWMHRSMHKPLGYPGDYRVMRYVYEEPFSGTTLFAKAVSLAFLQTKPARAVCTRKDMIRNQLAKRIAARPRDGSPINILSVAAGPAQEIFELLDQAKDLGGAVNIVLFDQERQALSYAYGRLQKLVERKWAGQVNVVYRYDTIKRLLRQRDIFQDLGTFDVVIASGLFDYLNFTTAARLTGTLEASLAPGGSLYIGNMVPSNPGKWFMEFHLDWHLTYRTHEDMLAFGRTGTKHSTVEIIEEETGINPFLSITRGG